MDYYIDVQTNSLEHDAKAHTIDILKVNDEGEFFTNTYEIINDSTLWSVSKPIQDNPLHPKTVLELLPYIEEGDRLLTFNGHFVTNVLYNTFGDILKGLGVRHVISLMDIYLYYNPKLPVSLNTISYHLQIPSYFPNTFRYYNIHTYISQQSTDVLHKLT